MATDVLGSDPYPMWQKSPYSMNQYIFPKVCFEPIADGDGSASREEQAVRVVTRRFGSHPGLVRGHPFVLEPSEVQGPCKQMEVQDSYPLFSLSRHNLV